MTRPLTSVVVESSPFCRSHRRSAQNLCGNAGREVVGLAGHAIVYVISAAECAGIIGKLRDAAVGVVDKGRRCAVRVGGSQQPFPGIRGIGRGAVHGIRAAGLEAQSIIRPLRLMAAGRGSAIEVTVRIVAVLGCVAVVVGLGTDQPVAANNRGCRRFDGAKTVFFLHFGQVVAGIIRPNDAAARRPGNGQGPVMAVVGIGSCVGERVFAVRTLPMPS